MLIAVHGSDRHVRGLLSGLNLDGGVSLLAPLFPAKIGDHDASDDYKFLNGGGTDYLRLMDCILAEALEHLGHRPRRIWLFGFSGGAQFAQRYALFRAAQLDGLVLAAPGGVTLLRDDVTWWPGLSGAEAATGATLDRHAITTLRTAILVGSEDRAKGVVNRGPGTRFGSAQADLAGETRIDKVHALHDSLTALGADVTLTLIPGAGHTLAPCTKAASHVLRGWLDQKQASTVKTLNRSSQ
ncbi:alpha/beta hydrolase [Monaibacterium marinum]|uniref:alpha/beta hydrolase n=1 Tax=Pontivivens marinum TaxID=1690039 RepID=UPI001FEA3B7C|nr:alpha/beta hydrolase [Monaibacterium marinum]